MELMRYFFPQRYKYVSEDYSHRARSVTSDHCEQGTNSMEELWSSVKRLLWRQKRDVASLPTTKQVESWKSGHLGKEAEGTVGTQTQGT